MSSAVEPLVKKCSTTSNKEMTNQIRKKAHNLVPCKSTMVVDKTLTPSPLTTPADDPYGLPYDGLHTILLKLSD